jgi:uncharacterized protein (TIGR03118 family)
MQRKTYVCLSQAAGLLALAAFAAPAPADTIYQENNLVSDILGLAPVQDTKLVNPWGIDSSDTSPFWISDNKTGMSTLYNGAGAPFPLNSPLQVTIPPPSQPPSEPPSTSAPTGVVFSGGSHFAPDSTDKPPLFLFATEDGTVAGWGGGTNAVLRVDNSPSEAIYKGIAISSDANTSLLYTTNFHAGTVDTFDANFVRTTLTGSFADPNIPAGFAPFNIENIGGQLYVTYAMQDKDKHDDVAGAGNGFIDIFSTDGNLVKRLVKGDPHVNSPWGMAIASPSFGQFAGKLLVGNFGDGTISVFDPSTGAFLGQLKDKNGDVITIPGLWGLKFGNGGNAGDVNTLFFTAGIPGPDAIEDHGLFGELTVVPEPNASLLLLAGLGMLAAARLRRR